MAYIDTSVLVAYYCPESLSDKVTKELQRLDEGIISPLVGVELISALAMKIRLREMSIEKARAIIAQFRAHLSQGIFTSIEIRVQDYSMAGEWLASFVTPLRGPDAIHLAIAFSQHQPLLTTDRDLAKAARTLAVKCKLIA